MNDGSPPNLRDATDFELGILLVDDHEMCRIGMRRLFERRKGWRVIGEAASPAEALRLARELRPDIAIVDLRLKDGDGVELIRALHVAHPRLRLLANSVHDEELYADRCLQAGASGYVEKSQPAATLLAAVETAMNGGVHLSEAMGGQKHALVLAGHATAFPLDTLTPREREVYAMIGRGQSVKEIAHGLQLSPKTVEYHRQQIRKKLGLASGAALARHAASYTFGTRGHVEP